MDSKERVMRSLDFLPVDRIARFDGFWPEFEQILIREQNLPPNTDLLDYFSIDIAIATADETPYPGMWSILEDTEEGFLIRNKYGVLVRGRRGAYSEEELEYTICEPDDLKRHPFESPHLPNRFTAFADYVKAEKAKGKCVIGKVGGPFSRSTFMRGKENYLLELAGDPDFAAALAQTHGDFLLEIALEELHRGELYDTGIWIYDDMGYNNGPLFSPHTFETIFLPVYRKMVRTLKDAGAKKVCLHSDGDIRLLLDMLIDAGIDAINPVEPKANMDIVQLREKYGKKLAYIGGMCNSDVLKNGPPERIGAQARRIIDAAREGGVIIGSHSIGPDIPTEHYFCYDHYVNTFGRFR